MIHTQNSNTFVSVVLSTHILVKPNKEVSKIYRLKDNAGRFGCAADGFGIYYKVGTRFSSIATAIFSHHSNCVGGSWIEIYGISSYLFRRPNVGRFKGAPLSIRSPALWILLPFQFIRMYRCCWHKIYRNFRLKKKTVKNRKMN